jgi:hypothetical protein
LQALRSSSNHCPMQARHRGPRDGCTGVRHSRGRGARLRWAWTAALSSGQSRPAGGVFILMLLYTVAALRLRRRRAAAVSHTSKARAGGFLAAGVLGRFSASSSDGTAEAAPKRGAAPRLPRGTTGGRHLGGTRSAAEVRALSWFRLVVGVRRLVVVVRRYAVGCRHPVARRRRLATRVRRLVGPPAASRACRAARPTAPCARRWRAGHCVASRPASLRRFSAGVSDGIAEAAPKRGAAPRLPHGTSGGTSTARAAPPVWEGASLVSGS